MPWVLKDSATGVKDLVDQERVRRALTKRIKSPSIVEAAIAAAINGTPIVTEHGVYSFELEDKV